MMRYYKKIETNYLIAIGTGAGGPEITSAEYDQIMEIIKNRPQADGKGYKLKADLTWEEYDLPPVEEEETEPTYEEVATAWADAEYNLCLYEMGIEGVN